MTKNNQYQSKYKRNHYDAMPPAIPDRWLDYKPFGKVIEGTRIICFKVPLRAKFQNYDKPDTVWDIRTLLQRIPKLKSVIDLTNTNRYYKPAELKSHGIAYKKIYLQGQELPPEQKVQRFIDTIDSFTDKDSLIGVHCTHGLNRTGYMVCRYLRDRCHIPARDAIKRFEKARGYRIERENYIADLLGKIYPDSRNEIASFMSKKKQKKPLKDKEELEEESLVDSETPETPDPHKSTPILIPKDSESLNPSSQLHLSDSKTNIDEKTEKSYEIKKKEIMKETVI